MKKWFGYKIFFAFCFLLPFGLFANALEPKISVEENEQLWPKIKDHYRKEAEDFLKENKKRKSIVDREGGYLQYETLKEGKGEKISVYQTPIVKISGHYLDNSLFLPPIEKMLVLDETLPSLKKILLEMKVGEKRKVFLHPQLSLGHSFSSFFAASSFPPFSQLVSIEIEVLSLEKPKNPFQETPQKNFR